MQPSPDHHNPYGLQRPPYPPTAWAPPPPVPAMPPPYAAPQVDAAARPAAIALLVSAAAMLIGLASYSWFTRGNGGVGLVGVQDCGSSFGCHAQMWTDLGRAPLEYALFGYVGLLALVGGVALSIHTAVMLLQNRARDTKVRALNAFLGIAAFCTVSFWMRLQFGELGHRLTVGYAGILCIAGVVVAGTLAHRTVRRLARS